MTMPQATGIEPTTLAATTVCAGLEYWVERGEIEHLKEVLTHVRYTSKTTESFDVVCDGRVVRFFTLDVGPAPISDEEEDGPWDDGIH